MPDYVLEGSKGTPFEGKDHTYYTTLSTASNICFVTYNLKRFHASISLPAGGYYYGKLKFPPDYPFKPPSIRCGNL
jgi:ubiquitin-protein ligase